MQLIHIVKLKQQKNLFKLVFESPNGIHTTLVRNINGLCNLYMMRIGDISLTEEQWEALKAHNAV